MYFRINPHKEIKMTDEDYEQIGDRLADGIKRFTAVPNGCAYIYSGFADPVHYKHQPLTDYQRWLRRGASSKVHLHYTRGFKHNIVER